ncbi:MAG: DUF1624 domain-containing protein [Planctomycetota bacterium]
MTVPHHRLAALDWMRGLVMSLMALDHADAIFNRGHRAPYDDTNLLYGGTLPDTAQFLTRWVTHLCAPTFLFLAGTSLALSIGRRKAEGESDRSLDRHLLLRGCLIALLDPLVMTWCFGGERIIFQVLFAIGVSMILMVPLRRLGARWLFCLAVSILLLGELLVLYSRPLRGVIPDLVFGASIDLRLPLLGSQQLLMLYPVLPWLAMLMLGWVLGCYLREQGPAASARVLLLCGGLALCLFAALRADNGYGNMFLSRADHSLLEWLHVSKYPPSLTFTTLELGIMCVVLAGLLRLGRGGHPRPGNPLLVFGQTALFFYLLHIPILGACALGFGILQKLDLQAGYLGALAVLIVLYPSCRWYGRYKRAHPGGWSRYL